VTPYTNIALKLREDEISDSSLPNQRKRTKSGKKGRSNRKKPNFVTP
jgi:hypothetical protein